MLRPLSDTDREVLAVVERYVRSEWAARRKLAEPTDWRAYHEAAKRKLVAYPRSKAG
jgi:hypothetical protein